MNTRARPPLAPVDGAYPEHGSGNPAARIGTLVGPPVNEDELVRIARARFTEDGLAELSPDAAARDLLLAGERLLVVDYATLVEAPGVCREDRAAPGGFGCVYVTTERLIHRGQAVLALPLEDVHDAAVTSGRLLLVLRGGGGVALETPWPRLLRLQVGMARLRRKTDLRARQAGSARCPRQASQTGAIPPGGLAPVGDAELAEDAADVGLHRAR